MSLQEIIYPYGEQYHLNCGQLTTDQLELTGALVLNGADLTINNGNINVNYPDNILKGQIQCRTLTTGDFVQSNGSIAANTSIIAGTNLYANGSVNGGSANVTGNIASGGNISATGGISASQNITAAGNLTTTGGNVLAAQGSVVCNDVSATSTIDINNGTLTYGEPTPKVIFGDVISFSQLSGTQVLIFPTGTNGPTGTMGPTNLIKATRIGDFCHFIFWAVYFPGAGNFQTRFELSFGGQLFPTGVFDTIYDGLGTLTMTNNAIAQNPQSQCYSSLIQCEAGLDRMITVCRHDPANAFPTLGPTFGYDCVFAGMFKCRNY